MKTDALVSNFWFLSVLLSTGNAPASPKFQSGVLLLHHDSDIDRLFKTYVLHFSVSLASS